MDWYWPVRRLVCRLDEAHRSLEFLDSQLSQLSEVRDCSICFEQVGVAQLSLLSCGHVFHHACAAQWLRASGSCPHCRAPARPSDLRPAQRELAPAPKRRRLAEPELPQAWRHHGSKLNAVAQLLRRLQREDPTSKAIVFVQWQDLLTQVGRAFKDHGVPFSQLAGRCEDHGKILAEFQTAPAPHVLLLSLQRAASGAHLTAASHVVLLHPMNATSRATAVAFEQQAIARVRRIGQPRKEVHVYRFVTRQTIEETMHRSHAETPAAASGAELNAGLAE